MTLILEKRLSHFCFVLYEFTAMDLGVKQQGNKIVINTYTKDRKSVEGTAFTSLGRIYAEWEVSGQEEYKLKQRAFRYIFVSGCESAEVEAYYEYLPLEYRGSFRCNDEELNKLWDVCAYTLHLNCREVIFDGIKRDRWAWGGEVYVYLSKDALIVKATKSDQPTGEQLIDNAWEVNAKNEKAG